MGVSEKKVFYFLKIEDLGECGMGCTPESVADVIRNEIESNEDLPAADCHTFTITPKEMTQEEYDALPEFRGW